MIVWLASYPKSGNTWVRLFLDYLFSSKENFNINSAYIKQFPLREHFKNLTTNTENVEELAKYYTIAQDKLNLDNEIKILKTHNAFWTLNNKHSFTDVRNTLGVIYIVRDPRNVVTSILNYYRKENYQSAFNFLKDDKVIGGTEDENGIPTLIASWSNHYKSWKKFKKNYLLVKYEDLLNDPKREFLKITNFLSSIGHFKFQYQKILKAIDLCEFKNLSKEEDLNGFKGNPQNNKLLNKKFFDLGPKNKWEIFLNKDIQKNIESEFKDEMVELEYL